MRAGKALASAPRWVRGLWWAGLFAIYFGVLAWFVLRRVVRAPVGVGVGVVLGGAVGVALVLSESRQLRRLARRIGLVWRPGRVAGGADRRRCGWCAGGGRAAPGTRSPLRPAGLRQPVGVRFSAACFATVALIFITLPALSGDGGGIVVGLVIAVAMSVVICPGLVRIPRYRRVLRVLTPDDATRATQPAATFR